MLIVAAEFKKARRREGGGVGFLGLALPLQNYRQYPGCETFCQRVFVDLHNVLQRPKYLSGTDIDSMSQYPRMQGSKGPSLVVVLPFKISLAMCFL